MCVYVSRPKKIVTFLRKNVTPQNGLLIFHWKETHSENMIFFRISSNIVTTTTANPGNRRRFCVGIFKVFAIFLFFFCFFFIFLHFSSFFIWLFFIFSFFHVCFCFFLSFCFFFSFSLLCLADVQKHHTTILPPTTVSTCAVSHASTNHACKRWPSDVPIILPAWGRHTGVNTYGTLLLPSGRRLWVAQRASTTEHHKQNQWAHDNIPREMKNIAFLLFFHFSSFFIVFFFFSSRPSRRQNPRKNSPEVLIVKMTIPFLGEFDFWVSVDRGGVGKSPFEGDPAFIFQVFFKFLFFLKENVYFSAFLHFFQICFIAGISITVWLWMLPPKSALHVDVVSRRHWTG